MKATIVGKASEAQMQSIEASNVRLEQRIKRKQAKIQERTKQAYKGVKRSYVIKPLTQRPFASVLLGEG